MAPRKLSDTDKLEMTKLYCQPGETTSTLATKFGVSSSTVSRVLKQMLTDDDYAQLMQWKRTGERGSLDLEFRLPDGELSSSEAESEVVALESAGGAEREDPDAPDEVDEVDEVEAATADEPTVAVTAVEANQFERPINRRSRRRSAVPTEATAEAENEAEPVLSEAELAPLTETVAQGDEQFASAWVSDGLEDSEDYDDDEDDFDDDDEEEDDDWEEDEPVNRTVPTRKEQIEILPFDEFLLQKPCYLVVDRLSELITCPLKEFAELGLIPLEEEQARTLPIFDNHRVARRFARRNQRIIKIPNGVMLNKTQPYLHAKGITRLLFDGQVYALN